MKALRSILTVLTLVCVSVGLAFVTASAEDGYVACSNSDDVIPFDLVSYTIGTPIPLLADYPYPYDATMSPDGAEVWVPDASGDHVVVIDVATNTITHTIPVGEYPTSVVFTDDGSSALVSSRDGDYVAVIKTSMYAVTDSLWVLTGSGGTYDGPGNMALDPVSKNIYALDWYDDTLYEIDPDASTVLRIADIGTDAWQLVVDPNGTYIYVADRGPDVVRVIDRATLTEVTTVPVGTDPWGIDVTLDGSRLVVACEDVSSAYVIDTSDWSTTIVPLGAGADPRDVDILDSDHSAFIAGGDATGTDCVYVLELVTNTLKSSIPVGGNPNCVAVQAQVTSEDVGIDGGENAARMRLECHPNPFNPKTTVRYYVRQSAEVRLAVYDLAGRTVDVLEEGLVTAGEHEVGWDGSSADGRPVASGVYFVRLDAPKQSRTI
ncbi:MAG: beta-propeller fold lactonase family protein, partial [Candidatus Eisenbacteria bacterium]|nr:beta-propeller fold lactonase family protein [Candidatus Eisenbacteria bacterium]